MALSSVTTVFPTGVVQHWCLAPIYGFNVTHDIADCAAQNISSNFQTVCCNGDIIDTTGQAFLSGIPLKPLNLSNIICCQLSGPQDENQNAGTFVSVQPSTCKSGTPTPIVNLAATNTENAAPYYIDFTDLPTGFGWSSEIVATATPNCLWLNTVSGASLATLTVPAAAQETDSAPLRASPQSRSSSITTGPTSASSSQPRSHLFPTTTTKPSAASISLPGSFWERRLVLILLVICVFLV